MVYQFKVGDIVKAKPEAYKRFSLPYGIYEIKSITKVDIRHSPYDAWYPNEYDIRLLDRIEMDKYPNSRGWTADYMDILLLTKKEAVKYLLKEND